MAANDRSALNIEAIVSLREKNHMSYQAIAEMLNSTRYKVRKTHRLAQERRREAVEWFARHGNRQGARVAIKYLQGKNPGPEIAKRNARFVKNLADVMK